MKTKFVMCLLLILLLIPEFVSAETEDGIITLDLLHENNTVSIQEGGTQVQPVYLEIAKIADNEEEIVWDSIIDGSEDLNISVPSGDYKIYMQTYDSRSVWEFDNNGEYYEDGFS